MRRTNPAVPERREYLAVGQNQWYHFGVGEFTTHFRLFGMFTGGTLVTHGQFSKQHVQRAITAMTNRDWPCNPATGSQTLKI